MVSTFFFNLIWFFVWFRRLYSTLFILISRLCAVYFLFLILVWCLFDSSWNICFEQVHIQSMTLASSMLQIWRYEYSGKLNIVIFTGITTFPFYVINTDDVSLFTNSSFLFLAILNFYCINVLYQFEFERMDIVYFCKIN